jgi:hypothetical protein
VSHRPFPFGGGPTLALKRSRDELFGREPDALMPAYAYFVPTMHRARPGTLTEPRFS